MIKVRIWLMSVMVIVMMISATSALPEMLNAFNAKYNTQGTRLDTCDTCHIPSRPQKPTCSEICHMPNNVPNNTLNKFQKEIPQRENPQSLNPYGMALEAHLNIEVPLAFLAIEKLDSDGDRFTNIDEIHNLTFPGDSSDIPNKKKNNFINPILANLKKDLLYIIQR